jgi:glutamate racemase
LLPKIEQQLAQLSTLNSQFSTIKLIPQGQYIASSLEDYLHRHPEMDARLTRGGTCQYLTTESATKFRESATLFLNEEVDVQRITLN